MASLPPADAEARKEAALSECVRLLSSESREKKFVGMLLVTRLLPDASDDASLTRIYDAPGFSAFVTSMLRAAPTPASETDAVAAEELEARAAQASASHALALAACAALSGCREVATRPSMAERLPLFAAAAARKARYKHLPSTAVADACEAAIRVVAAGGEPAAAVAADVGVVAAAAAAVVASAPVDATTPEADPDPDRNLPALAAMQLLALLLESPAAYDAVHGAADRSTEPGTEKDDSGSRRSARAVARCVPALAATLAARPGRPEQIEALRCLSLALSALPARRPGGFLTAELARVAAKSTKGGSTADWRDDLRGGARSVLAAKAPRELRLAALDLCAAAVDLLGESWVCGDALGRGGDPLFAGGPAGADEKTPVVPPTPFYRVVLELARVETAVLLHDLTRDDAAVRAAARDSVSVPLVAYERLVAALAADAQAAEEEEEEEEEEARAKGAREPRRSRERRHRLSAETAQAAVGVLADIAGSILDFLEHAAEEKAAAEVAEAKASEAKASEAKASGAVSASSDGVVVLAAARALGAFCAELPEAHATRVDALLPALLADPRRSSRAMAPDTDSRVALIRFMLPYLLQATETPAGLDAFDDADGAEAAAALALRAIARAEAAGPSSSPASVSETAGACAAACAALRNAAAGAEAGLCESAAAAKAARAFARVRPALARWADGARLPREDEDEGGRGGGGAAGREDDAGEDDGSLRGAEDVARFVRAARAMGPGGCRDDRSGSGFGDGGAEDWRGALETLRALVPDGEASGFAETFGFAETSGAETFGATLLGGGTGPRPPRRFDEARAFEDPIEL